MRALVTPCTCTVCEGAAPDTPEARELARCRGVSLPLHLERILATWARLGLWAHSARGLLLQLPPIHGELCDAYDRARGEALAKERREREQRDMVQRMLGGGR